MDGRNSRSGASNAILALIAASLFTPSLVADSPSPAPQPRISAGDPSRIRADAEAAEKDGRWDRAVDLYLKLYLVQGPTAELREKIRVCLRYASQSRRQHDPAFQQFVLSLPVAESLNIYTEAVTKLGGLYADRDRAAAGKLFALGLDELDRALADPAFRERHLEPVTDLRLQKFRQSLRGTWRTRLPASPREARHAARELVFAAQTQAGVRNPSAVVLELICGACSGLDEYTMYLAPTGSQAHLAEPIAEFASYGILVVVRNGSLFVDGLVPGSWAAAHTPLRKGDEITRVNGRDLTPATAAGFAEAVRVVTPFGHELELAAMDMSSQTVRLPVPLPSVYAMDMIQAKDGIGYVRVATFRDTTARELDEAVFTLQKQGMRSLVLDLRGNVGGAFTAGVEMSQRFLPTGIIVSTQGQVPEFDGRVFSSDAGMAAWEFPVALLVDTKTMSAAEIVAVSLKEHNRATLVGLPTFGKGAVQYPVRLQPTPGAPEGKGGMLILTVATVHGPRGGAINGSGVVPHILEPDPIRQLELAVLKLAELTGNR